MWAQPSIVVLVLRHRHARWWGWAGPLLAGIGLLLVAVGVLFVLVPGLTASDSLVAPLSVVVGVLILNYCRSLAALRSRGRRPRVGTKDQSATVLVLAVATLSLFWSANSFAEQYGRGLAVDLSHSLHLRPAVTLDTTEELFLQLPGVIESALPTASADQAFHFRYRGLRLLAQSGDRMFLVPSSWSPGSGRALMVTRGATVRLQFAAG